MTQPRQLRDIGVAMIGTGFMAAVHVEALSRVWVGIAGILGSTPEKSRRAAARLGLARAYGSLEEALSDPRVHSVHLGVPNRLHLPMARAALKAGKHVLCEKPLAMDSRESGELLALSRERPELAAGVNYNVRFYPLCIESREMVRRGDLGELFHACGSYAQDWLALETDYNWRVLAGEGGALRAAADIGSHWLDLARWITGREVVEVCADLKTVHPVRRRPRGEVETFQAKGRPAAESEAVPVATDDYGAVLIRFSGGGRGCLWVSQAAPGRKNLIRIEIAGSRSSLAWESERCDELWIGRRDRPNELLIRDPALLSTPARAACDSPGGHAEGYADTFKQCFRSFYAYIAAGDFSADRPFPTFEDGHREVLLGEAILRSHREGGWAQVEGVP